TTTLLAAYPSKLVCAFIQKQQLEQSELTLSVEPEQIPHLHSSDPVISWENLCQVHVVRRFASPLVLCFHFITIKTDKLQSMSH
ncbi:hypothetical protein BU17DRAFT_44357, partial [Hysterangium stoloniferum]